MELKGKVHFIGQTIPVSDTFKKRELVVEYAENPQYPEFVKFEAIQDRTSLMDGLNVGQKVEVFFNLSGREWADKNGVKQYFNSLKLWKVNVIGQVNAPIPAAANVDEDGLPF